MIPLIAGRLPFCSRLSFSASTRRLSTTSNPLTTSYAQRSTIYALSTPPGKAGVAVIRVSGPQALDVHRQLVKPVSSRARGQEPEPWKMQRCDFVHPESKENLDSGLAVFFRAPRSFTTEDTLELHIHSGRAIISSILSSLSLLPYTRPAEPGEFTRRAFVNGRMDLTQAEGLKDLIDAETEVQRKLASRAAGGAVRSQFEDIRSQIIKCLSTVEALIDFGEGEDIEPDVHEQARQRAKDLRETIQGHLRDSKRGEIIRSGVRLAIFGPPNAGKSSLLNHLAQREAAIVTSIPGTTRDVLEISLDMDGLPVIVADTAGIRDTDDMVEAIGIERARQAIENSDISLCVLSLPEVLTTGENGEPEIQLPPSISSLATPSTIFLLNKSDLVSSTSSLGWTASLATEEGMPEFMSGFSKLLHERFQFKDDASAPLVTHARQRVHLETASRFIDAFLETSARDIVLGAEELRYAAQAVGKISGTIDTEDILDAVFRDFCIGK